jgi:Zn ribbon nucleic-acid-binding protein
MPKPEAELSTDAAAAGELCPDCEHLMSIHDEDGVCLHDLCGCGLDEDDDDDELDEDDEDFEDDDDDDEFEEDDDDEEYEEED